MQLLRFRLPAFRNLRALDIDFATHLPPAVGASADTPRKSIRSHALIGQNGTGKSNLIEALINLFRDLDLDSPQAPFDYELEYHIRGHHVRIQANDARQKLPLVWINGKQESQGFLVKHAREYLSSHIFAYYSGKNERIESLFRTHQDRYKQLLRQDNDDLVRRLFYCRGGHSQLVLLACLLSDDPEFKKLLDNLNIESIESELFVLKKSYAARDLDEQDIEGKCWFSEVRELYSHYDVEHFRPKKEAKALDASVRDGYWWLAFDYMNFRVCGNVGNRKKGGWFPLKEGSLCSTHTQPCEESETPYLLDPIDDGDVALIAFDEEGKVIPMPGSSAWEQQRVTETVKRLKLNEHVPLAEARRKVWQQVDQLIDDFNNAKARSSAGNNPAAKAKLTEVRVRMREMTSPAAELSAVARCCLLLRNDPQLLRLVG